MKNLHCLFLDRSDLKAGMKTILAAIEEIKNGVSICIFPEGTRNKGKDELELLPFMTEVSKLPPKQVVLLCPLPLAILQDFRVPFPENQALQGRRGILQSCVSGPVGQRRQKTSGYIYSEYHSGNTEKEPWFDRIKNCPAAAHFRTKLFLKICRCRAVAHSL